ncbi:uncharacterized protein C20orf204 homolog [Antechinus flavipes]|uniref:uncharacterized protein C20orf204 homolog n=1 Tax=Antechinus flavipes TaxID=38775 RepID=UPI002235820F|nr:uncharacterized protein C20orf204 homolog [Antechinus flavipes]
MADAGGWITTSMTRDPAFTQVLAKPAFCMLLLAILDSALGRGGRRKDCNVPDVLRHYRAVIFEELQAVVRKTPRGLLFLGKGHGLWEQNLWPGGWAWEWVRVAGAAYSCLLGQGQFLLWFYPEKLGKHQGSQAPGTRASRGRLLSGRKGNFSEKSSCSTPPRELGKGVGTLPGLGSFSPFLVTFFFSLPFSPPQEHRILMSISSMGQALRKSVAGTGAGAGRRRGALEKAVWTVAMHTEAVTREYCGTLHQVRPRPSPPFLEGPCPHRAEVAVNLSLRGTSGQRALTALPAVFPQSSSVSCIHCPHCQRSQKRLSQDWQERKRGPEMEPELNLEPALVPGQSRGRGQRRRLLGAVEHLAACWEKLFSLRSLASASGSY